MKRVLAAVVATFLVVSMVGCSQPTGVKPSPKPNQSQNNSATIDSIYAQKVTWNKCETSFQCARVSVPIDWANPDSGTVKLALIRKVAKKAKGYLVLNPGGPGGSGYDFLANNYSDIGTTKLRLAYTLVSFDPRGVSRSAPVKCLNAKQTNHMLYDSNGQAPGSAGDIADIRAQMKQFVAACVKNTGPILAHVDTVSAAKDLDVIRAILGEAKLNYLGFSYGTFLGTTYQALFPDKVGRFVLDGAIDPRVSDEDQNLNQLVGFNLALNDYLNNCLAKQSSCPFTGTLKNAQNELKAFLLSMESKTLKSDDGRKVSIVGVTSGLIMALYSNDYWQFLTQALNQAAHGNGTMFIRLADFYNDRNDNGTFNGNGLEAIIAINCLDARSSASDAAMAVQNQRVLQASPILGRYWQNGALTCEQWPYPLVAPPATYTANDAPKIMVVGTTGDPATPYSEAVGLAHDVLAHGFLVTFKGEGHTAYGRSNSCVSNAVDNFLVGGKFPSKEPVC